jgi:hypothetical protein
MIEKTLNRMTLRDLLIHTEKMSRDVTESVHTQFMPKVTEFRDLARTMRKKSQFPTLHTIDNSMHRVEISIEELRTLMTTIDENATLIAKRIQHERLDRM